MEPIQTKNKYVRRRRINMFITAIIFILVGLLFIGRNLGIVDPYLFRIIISWQSLLIVIGLVQLSRRNIVGGAIVLAVGVFFLLPKIGHFSLGWEHVWWPLIFVFVGVVLLLKLIPPLNKNCHHPHHHHPHPGRHPHHPCEEEVVYESTDGFASSDNSFGVIRQIILDPVFKGAKIKNRFGSTVLDLRRTNLEATDTYIDVDCSFGGVEIYVPENWTVKIEINPVFGGCDDKRYNAGVEPDHVHRLIIRGKITFSGLEVKS
ncbi:cell wall-active antibiotics response protein [Porphyromonadaceae bacterium OttesenSCG-928-L07]|nr:cell wall-active antibiotics response protein [Porphyromonadaceae bacterium OttesenSCG-928-L07]